MEKQERETRDFMSVEYFSQLPFLRPSPSAKEKGGGGGGIRLFGQEFTGATNDQENTTAPTGEGEASSRKFECHYCCRNFPTSQALGGHQNAHKRERQNAKRAHLQSVMVHGGVSDGHDYRFMNYGRFGSAPPPLPPPPPYHSWTTRSYGSHGSLYNGHHSQPINGSPLGLWRIPVGQTSSPFHHKGVYRQTPLMNPKEEQLKPLISKPVIRDHVSLDLHL